MRVALLPGTSLEDPTYAGALRGLARDLRRLGHRIRIFCPTRARGLAAFRPHVLHLHFSGHLNRPALAHVRRALRDGAALVLTFQDLDHPDMPARGAAQTRLVTRLVDRSRAVTALTPGLARLVRRAYPGAGPKLTVVPNGVGEEWFRVRPAAEGGRIACIARLAPYKGVDILLWAFRALVDRQPSARLTVYGPDFQGGHHLCLARRLGLGAAVRFAGKVAQGRIRKGLGRARFVVSASRSETYGVAVLEAMASGKAVVATRTGAAAALLGGRGGLLVPPGDPQALLRGMSRLWSDRGLRRRLGRAARREARKHRWERSARAYAALYAASARADGPQALRASIRSRPRRFSKRP